MTFILTIVFVFYGLLLLFLYIGWERATKQKIDNANGSGQFISVIIPVRNEERTIGHLLDDLNSQILDKNRFEVIVVDDHSEDNTLKIVHDKIENGSVILSAGSGKKAALTSGVKNAKGTIIVTTDADCNVGINWLESIDKAFSDGSVKMVFGAVKIESVKEFFSKIQALEFSSLIGSGAATMAFGVPTMCNGANLAFRKETFEEVRGYEGNETIASGDDEFLMRKIASRYPTSIRFSNHQESIVTTKPQESLMQFMMQRLRWAGKWKYHTDLSTRLLALFIFGFHLSVLLLPFFYKFYPGAGDMLLALILSKIILEYIFLDQVTSWLRIKWHWSAFMLLQILYPVYAIVIGIGSLFLNPVWKGRK